MVRQVRATAQRLIAEHLRDSRGDDDRDADVAAPTAFWEPMDIDLTGAHLRNVTFDHCRIKNASFEGAKFTGLIEFDGTVFTGSAIFKHAEFSGTAWF